MAYRIIFLDTETTGVAKHDRLIQLCYKVHGTQTPVTKLYCPPVPISFEAMAVHHITPEDVAAKPTFAQSGDREALQELLQESILVAHNAAFDIEMLRREGVQTNMYIDTLKICRYLLDEPTYKLQYLRYKLGIDVKEAKAHDAQGDVEILQALWLWLVRRMKEQSENVFSHMVQLSRQPTILRRIHFGKYRGFTFEEIPRDYLHWLSQQSDWDEDLRYTIDHYMNLPHEKSRP